jgi:hypothetical protein
MKQNKRIDARSKARLKWFLDFLYLDVDSLSPADFFKLLADLGNIAKPELLLKDGGKFPWVDSPQERQKVKGYQEDLMKELEHILGMAQFSKSQGKAISEGTLEIAQIITVTGDRVSLSLERIEDSLRTEFLQSLSPFSLNDIKKCEREDCGRYFLKATKKEKRYCSNKCAWVVGSRKRRAAYPKKERERKRLSYERRKRRELGPRVRVQTRKTKEG